MINEPKIITKEVRTPFLTNDGQLLEHNYYHLELECLESYGKTVTRDYQAMGYLCDDHYSVCDLVIKDNTSCYANDYFMDTDMQEKNVKASYLWGVIRVNRDSDGNIIPQMETLIIPYLFTERLMKGELNTAIAEYNGKYIFFDLDMNSELYGKSLTPFLDHAEPFGFKYDGCIMTDINGFAKCSMNDITGYLPRNCIKRFTLQPKDLLTGQQALMLSLYLNGKPHRSLSIETIMAYKNLTGSNPKEQRSMVLKKK